MIRILLATENAIDRKHIAALLESNPEHTVIGQAENGIEAVKLAKRLLPDLVAMDIDMPLMDGIEATRQIMSNMPTRVVVLSAGEDGPDLGRGAEALRAGAVTVVPKPMGRGPFSDLRQEIFLEMVRAAIRKDLRLPPPAESEQDTFATSWLRPSATAYSNFSPEELADDFDSPFELIGLPLSVEDRASRIRRLMDDIR